MKLKSIKLDNIGLYKNERIHFPYVGKDNTIIFWGNNGAGKTTLINSVKIGLLGKDAVKMSYSEYCHFIKTKMVSTRCDLERNEASIELEIEIKDKNENGIYRIKRTWSEKEGFFVENESIEHNDAEIKIEEKDYIKNLIGRALPPSLLDVIIFDGENAIDILNEGMINKLIKDIIFSVFGMDVYNTLSRDLTTFLRSEKSNGDITAKSRLDMIKIEGDYKASLKNNQKLEMFSNEIKMNKLDKLGEINFLLRKFADKTGVDVEDIEKLNANLAEANLNKEKLNADLKYLNEEILPLKLVHRRISQIIQEINDNEPYKVLSTLEKLKDFFKERTDAQEWIFNLENLLPFDKKEVKYDLSDDELKIIKNVNDVLNTYTVDNMLNVIKTKNVYLKEIRNKISISNKIESKESQELLENLENLYSELKMIENQLLTINDELNESRINLEENKKAYLELKAEITKQKKESSSYIMAFNYREAIDEFVEENINEVCLEINNILKSYLQDIEFRNDSIGNIEISPKSFEINLYEKNGKLIPSFLFSAGEKQVLLGLVIKAAMSLTAMDNFFLFDTPVGRLDKGNRELFTREVIFPMSEQVFIFATDSDYSEDDYKNISSSITAEFKLCRNEKDEIVAMKGSIY